MPRVCTCSSKARHSLLDRARPRSSICSLTLFCRPFWRSQLSNGYKQAKMTFSRRPCKGSRFIDRKNVRSANCCQVRCRENTDTKHCEAARGIYGQLAYSSGSPLNRKRSHRTTGHDSINELIFEWFKMACSKNIHISGSHIQQKAVMFAREIGNVEFTASNG